MSPSGSRDARFFCPSAATAGLPVCLKDALKLKEISYTATDAYAAGGMKHGSVAPLEEGTPVVVVATDSLALEKVIANMHGVRARGATVIAVAAPRSPARGPVLRVPDADWMLQPLLAVIPLQLLASRIAGCAPSTSASRATWPRPLPWSKRTRAALVARARIPTLAAIIREPHPRQARESLRWSSP